MRNIFISLLPLSCTLLASLSYTHEQQPLGQELISWKSDESIIRTLSNAYNLHGGGNTVSWRPNGRIIQAFGRECIFGPQFLFDVDDNFAFDIDEKVTLEVLIDTSISTSFNISWDHAINPTSRSINLNYTENENLQWVKIDLERSRFANRLYGGTDFSIAAANATIFPQDANKDHELMICDMRLRRQRYDSAEVVLSELILSVTDENGLPTAVRAGLYTSDGKMPLASESALEISRYDERVRQLPLRKSLGYWPSSGRFVFYIDGIYRAAIPPGEYTLVLAKGPEYRLIKKEVSLTSGSSTELKLSLKRWINMPERGWFSADSHVHIKRKNQSVNAGVLSFLQAEDVHLTNLLEMTNIGNSHYHQYAFGTRGQYLDGVYALAAGQESPRTSHLGHTIGLNAAALHLTRQNYYLYDQVARAVKQDGGTWGYAHAAIGAFNLNRGLALDVPAGIVDFIEILQLNTINPTYLYDFLNMGFKIRPSAGSDFPYMHVPGAERIYTQLVKQFSVESWFDAWQNGRSFVSNGPIIEFQINGESRANEVSISSGQRVRIIAKASINPDLDKMTRLELISHGKVVAKSQLEEGSESISLAYDFYPNKSQWLAIRGQGEAMGKVHTAPFFLYVDGNKNFSDASIIKQLAGKYIRQLDEIRDSTPDLNTEWEHFDVGDVMVARWVENKKDIDRRIEKAKNHYLELISSAQ